MSSSESGYHFVWTFDGSLQTLVHHHSGDSLQHIYKIVQVTVPPGAKTRLVSAHGDLVVPLDDKQSSNLIDRSAPLVELSLQRTVRGRTLVAVKISPVTGDAVYSQVDVQLAFDAGNRRPDGSIRCL